MQEIDVLTYFIENKHQTRRDILKNILTLCDIVFEVEPFDDGFYQGENIIVSLTKEDEYTLLVGHYDVFEDSLGINDNATSIAALITFILETKARKQWMRPVKILFADLEEKGMRGSLAYAKKHKQEIKEAVVLDIVGYGDMFIYGSHQRFDALSEAYMKEVNMVLPSDNIAFERKNIRNVLITAIHQEDTRAVSGKLVQIANFQFSESFHNGSKDNDLSQINLELLASLKYHLIRYLSQSDEGGGMNSAEGDVETALNSF